MHNLTRSHTAKPSLFIGPSVAPPRVVPLVVSSRVAQGVPKLRKETPPPVVVAAANGDV